MADGGCDEYAQLLPAQMLPELTQVDHPVHHLGHAETVAEVVERVVAVVLLHAQLKREKHAGCELEAQGQEGIGRSNMGPGRGVVHVQFKV